MKPISNVQNIDCMIGMREFPPKFFDLAIVDPPYGSDNINGGYNSGKGGGVAKQKNYNRSLWKQAAPDLNYFDELFRVSKHQIIWGANHLMSKILKDASCWIVWDKLNPGHFADCELAWTSFQTAVRKFEFTWAGFIQHDMSNKENRIHPTQKPVALYKWLLQNYAKPNDKILDTHLGSQSSRIAAYKLGFDFWGYEIDQDYFKQGCERFEKAIAEPLFDVKHYTQSQIWDER